MRAWPGDPAPLGATFDGVGTNIAVFSNIADAVSLCVFDDDGNEECVELPERSGAVFHGYFPDLEAGAQYGLRVHGPYDPGAGHRCDPSKLLIDPYARAPNYWPTGRRKGFLNAIKNRRFILPSTSSR